mgnify:CR=1 FL=1
MPLHAILKKTYHSEYFLNHNEMKMPIHNSNTANIYQNDYTLNE